MDFIRQVILISLLTFILLSIPILSYTTGEGKPQQPEKEDMVGVGRIAFSSCTSENWQIFSINPDGSDLSQLTQTSQDLYQPAWSPDGGRIA